MTEIPLHEEVHVLFLDIQMPELNGLESVSYTHLDVYKRQVEQRERSEEGAAESDKGSKSKLPLASCGVYQQGTFFVIASQREQ